MIIDCISDLHGHYPKLEGGDLLIVAGDLTANDTLGQINRLKDWLCQMGKKYKKMVMIAGNHDNWIQRREFFNRDESSWEHPQHSYLEDSGTEISYFDDRYPEEDEGFKPSGHRTLKIWGSPWTKTFPGMNPLCKAFTVDTDEELAEKWALIPDDVDILISHCPPWGILDKNIYGEHCGSKALLETLDRVKPRLLIFGHIHEEGGKKILYKHAGPNTWCINASHVNEIYQPVNKPIRCKL